MGRFIGPKLKLAKKFNDGVFCRKFGIKKQEKNNRVGHKKKTEYATLLNSKEKLLYLYNIREKQLSNYVCYATSKEGNSEDILSTILELRLDNVVYRLGLGKTRNCCRQLVSHGHIMVNNKIVNVSSYNVKNGDVISYNKSCNGNNNIIRDVDSSLNMYKWLSWDNDKKCGVVTSNPTRDDIPEKTNTKDVIEIYAK